jgi:hypothetical protein
MENSELMAIVKQVLLDQVLEYGSIFKFLSHFFRVLINFEETQGVSAM